MMTFDWNSIGLGFDLGFIVGIIVFFALPHCLKIKREKGSDR